MMKTDDIDQTQMRNTRGDRQYPIDRQIVLTGPTREVASAVDRVAGLERVSEREVLFREFAHSPAGDRFKAIMETRAANAVYGTPEKSVEREVWGRIVRVVEVLRTGTGPQGPGEDPIITRLYGVDPLKNTTEDALALLLEQIKNRGLMVTCEPNTIVGDPQTIGGSPATGMYANRGAFDVQWAFGQQGINLPGRTSGYGVRVGIFDTSPFDVPIDTPPCSTDNTKPHPHWMPWKSTISHPALKHLGPRKNTVACPDHGLCVASLLQHVAPYSDIELIRVLNMFVEGDDDTLALQLADFIDNATGVNGHRPVNGAIINLSLHVDTALVPGGVVPPLEYEVGRAVADGILVFAAAGNASEADAPTRKGPQYPASIGHVIAVSALSQEGEPAFFANKGDVKAPGSGLIGMITHEPPIAQNYQYVNGSSYAAPLAAGVGALWVQYFKSRGAPDPELPQLVEEAMGLGPGTEPSLKVHSDLGNQPPPPNP